MSTELDVVPSLSLSTGAPYSAQINEWHASRYVWETRQSRPTWWTSRHIQGYCSSHPVAMLLRALVSYADEHRDQFGSGIGEDGVLGPDWAKALVAVRGLLNGSIGQLDGGSCDSIILALLIVEGFTDKNGEPAID